MAKNTVSSMSSDDKWQAEDDCRTLQRAEEIKNDPKRLKRALDCAKEKQDELIALMKLGKGLRG